MEDNKKKILIIANLHHASPRISKILKYFKSNGWMPYVLTPPFDLDVMQRLGSAHNWEKLDLQNTVYIPTPYRGDLYWPLKKMLHFIGLKKNVGMTEQLKKSSKNKKSKLEIAFNILQCLFSFPDSEITWINPALKKAYGALNESSFDAILSSSPFPSVHIIASKLKKKHKIPWIADFRDPWTSNQDYPYPFFRKYLEQKYEKFVLKKVDAITTVNEAFMRGLSEIHTNKTIHIIRHGLELDNRPSEKIELTKKFTITYVGRIYTENNKHDPTFFLEALYELYSEKQISDLDLEVRFYGRKNAWLENTVENLGLSSLVSLYPPIERNEVFKREKESQTLLIFNWNHPDDKEYLPTKFFEYLATKRPIFAFCGLPGHDIANLISEYNLGLVAYTKEDIKKSILTYYYQYKKRGSLNENRTPSAIEELTRSYEEIAIKFLDVLNAITKNNNQ